MPPEMDLNQISETNLNSNVLRVIHEENNEDDSLYEWQIVVKQ